MVLCCKIDRDVPGIFFPELCICFKIKYESLKMTFILICHVYCLYIKVGKEIIDMKIVVFS
jgi:hypothetical protein